MPPTPAAGGSRSARNVPLLLLFNALAYAYAYVPVSYFFYGERGYALKGFASLRSVYYGAVVLAQLPTGLLADRNSAAKTKTADGAEAPSADS